MTNEELAVLIQAGDRAHLLTLWQQMRRMVLKQANRWVAYRSGGAELEDLEQAGFVALMRAVDTFDPAAGCRFSTWYFPIMQGEFERATSRRTERQQRDPLHAAVSLDMPVGEDEGASTLGELQADPNSELAFEDVEHRADNARLHAALESAISTLPPDLRAVIRGRYFEGRVVDANAHSKALRLLRNPRVSRSLRVYL